MDVPIQGMPRTHKNRTFAGLVWSILAAQEVWKGGDPVRVPEDIQRQLRDGQIPEYKTPTQLLENCRLGQPITWQVTTQHKQLENTEMNTVTPKTRTGTRSRGGQKWKRTAENREKKIKDNEKRAKEEVIRHSQEEKIEAETEQETSSFP